MLVSGGILEVAFWFGGVLTGFRMNIREPSKVGTSPVLFSSPLSLSVIVRIRDTLDHFV